jgi:hypothetical protein
MKNEYWHKINKIERLNDYNLELFFNDNTKLLFDLSPYFHKDSVFNQLMDKQLFNQVQISDDGRSLIFPNELDFCADSLWLKAHPERSNPY